MAIIGLQGKIHSLNKAVIYGVFWLLRNCGTNLKWQALFLNAL